MILNPWLDTRCAAEPPEPPGRDVAVEAALLVWPLATPADRPPPLVALLMRPMVVPRCKALGGMAAARSRAAPGDHAGLPFTAPLSLYTQLPGVVLAGLKLRLPGS